MSLLATLCISSCDYFWIKNSWPSCSLLIFMFLCMKWNHKTVVWTMSNTDNMLIALKWLFWFSSQKLKIWSASSCFQVEGGSKDGSRAAPSSSLDPAGVASSEMKRWVRNIYEKHLLGGFPSHYVSSKPNDGQTHTGKRAWFPKQQSSYN